MKVKQTIKWLLAGCLMLALLLSIAPVLSASGTGSDNPEQVIGQLQSSLLQVMREGEKLGYEGRYKFLEPVIDQSHDIDLIIKTILGATYWSQLDKTQQDLIGSTFRQLSIATYASRFTQYEGEQFKIIEQRTLPRDQTLVRSQLTKSDGGTVNFDYVLHQTEGHWRIANILFDGVSDLAIKRGEYRAVLQRDGFAALIELLKEKITLAQQQN
ncbi:MAG: ABC transporter substrate-binding protein [Nitrosomonas sp.]|nr:ABC transporter substrate-binding protein [Nitrosomonas sp.]